MARIDTKLLRDSLKILLEKEASERSISLNELTTEIFENYVSNKHSFESEKKFTEAMNNVSISMNKNTEVLERYIESNNKMIEILLD